MKYQLMRHGWPIADRLVPVGTIIDARSNDDWSKLARGRVPPLNAVALDQECADLMFNAYPWHRHLLHKAVQTLNVITNERSK